MEIRIVLLAGIWAFLAVAESRLDLVAVFGSLMIPGMGQGDAILMNS